MLKNSNDHVRIFSMQFENRKWNVTEFIESMHFTLREELEITYTTFDLGDVNVRFNWNYQKNSK